MRYLGGYLSPQCDYKEAKAKLIKDIEDELGKLRYKKFHWRELRYAIEAVIQAKFRYYSLVVPLSRTEITMLDNKIAQLARTSLGMARSSTSHIIFMPERSPVGFGFPCLADTEANQLLTTARELLNEKKDILHKIGMARLKAYQKRLNWTENPLATPTKLPKDTHGETYYKKDFWFSRVAAAAAYLQTPLMDTHGHLNWTTRRAHDIPLHSALPHTTYMDILPHLRTHKLAWIGDIADCSGTKLTSPRLIGITKSTAPPAWWHKLKEQVTQDDTSALKLPVSPTPARLSHRRLDLRVGDIVTSPGTPVDVKDPLGPAKTQTYIEITKVGLLKDREHFWGRELVPHRTRFTHIEQGTVNQRREVIMRGEAPLKRPPKPSNKKPNSNSEPWTTDDDAINVARIPAVWTKVGHKTGKMTSVLLPTEDHSVTTTYATSQGIISPQKIITINETILGRCYIGEDGLIYSDSEDEKTAPLCYTCNLEIQSDHLLTCLASKNCTGTFHRQCSPTLTPSQQHWSCPHCVTLNRPQPAAPQLTPETLHKIQHATSTIYVASDGSVEGAQTGRAKSAWGVAICIDEETIYTAKGAIDIRQSEESSLRAELQGLTQLYRILPRNIDPRVAVDNKSAIQIHDKLFNPHTKQLYSDVRGTHSYKQTVIELHKAIRNRQQRLNLTHTHSHKEMEQTKNADLRARRLTLAAADGAATQGHLCTPIRIQPEAFPLYHEGQLIEKSASKILKSIAMQKHSLRLATRKREGYLMSEVLPGKTYSTTHWPDGEKSLQQSYLQIDCH